MSAYQPMSALFPSKTLEGNNKDFQMISGPSPANFNLANSFSGGFGGVTGVQQRSSSSLFPSLSQGGRSITPNPQLSSLASSSSASNFTSLLNPQLTSQQQTSPNRNFFSSLNGTSGLYSASQSLSGNPPASYQQSNSLSAGFMTRGGGGSTNHLGSQPSAFSNLYSGSTPKDLSGRDSDIMFPSVRGNMSFGTPLDAVGSSQMSRFGQSSGTSSLHSLLGSSSKGGGFGNTPSSLMGLPGVGMDLGGPMLNDSDFPSLRPTPNFNSLSSGSQQGSTSALFRVGSTPGLTPPQPIGSLASSAMPNSSANNNSLSSLQQQQEMGGGMAIMRPPGNYNPSTFGGFPIAQSSPLKFDIFSTASTNIPAGLIVGKSSQAESQSEFQINNDEFPALQGTQIVDQRTGINNLPAIGSEGVKEQRTFTAVDRSISSLKKGIQSSTDGNVSNIPPGMISDQFGMVGLLTMLRAIEIDPTIVSLALGHDLTTLGLNLNAPDKNLHQSFGGPWADVPCRPQDIDYPVPAEYIINPTIRDKLCPIRLNRYSEDLLFHIFYNCCGELYQMAAAAELYNRDWRYHKEERVWLTRALGMPIVEKTTTYERGTYYVFDPIHWRKVPKEMHLEYEKLEDKPVLPQTGSLSAQPPTNVAAGGFS